MVVMRDPQGNDMPNPGVYLEVVKNERLVIHRRLYARLGSRPKSRS